MSASQSQWLQLCERSLRVEQKHQYCNLKGKEQFFADFMLKQVEASWLNQIHAPISNRLKNIYTLYPLANIAERKAFIQESWQHLEHLRELLRPRKVYTGDQVIKKAVFAQQAIIEKSGVSDWRDVPIQFVKSVGPKLGETFAKVGVSTVGDLVTYYPRKHLDYSQCTRISALKIDDMATIWGTLYRVSSYSPPGKPQLSILKLIIRDGSGRITLSLFQRGNAFMRRQMQNRFPEGAGILVSGKVKWDKFSKGLTLENPEYEILDNVEETLSETNASDNLNLGRIVPIYPLTEGLNIKWVRRAIYNALQAYQDKIQDPFSEAWRKRLELMPWGEALATYHYPDNLAQLEAARQRLVFQELFFTQLGLQYRRKQREIHAPGQVLHSQGTLAKTFLEALPFALTGAQERVYQEILEDLRRPEAMNRLVQGDVGSGKTVVAVLALLEAIESGYQGALMAPTEILAEQHFQKLFQWLLPLNIQVELLKGAQGAKTRREVLARIASGEARVVVGTHALIQDKVQFANLGLAVIDEQHRFGVKQRATLRDKGLNGVNGKQQPEVLNMTATPIPRTLALTQHGDLEVSSIDELPPGRKPIETQLIRPAQREQLWEFMRQQLEAGRQCYVVFPLVEESEKMDLKAATVEFEHYRDTLFADYGVGLLHGKMKPTEKEAIMAAFVKHEIHILVATTVIEVGVDVPNASVMVIEHANRFGLAQLHQLRGRVGRGADKAYCYLVADKSSEIAKERLKIFTTTHDGFVIAEQDLRLRGPGEFMGTRQSGLPDMLLTNLIEDAHYLELAREEAKALIEKDPELTQKEHLFFKNELFRFFRNHLQLLNA
jgi:ATP-dependent DNA helicase RecG